MPHKIPPKPMNYYKPLFGVGLIVVLLIGAMSLVGAHETREVEGYDVTFGGEDEPIVTGERMWLQLEIVDNETGEPVEGQADTLKISLQKLGNEKVPFEVSESHGEPGVYEVAVIFTEPGEYVIHMEGSIDGTEVHTHFETEVHDHTELEFPGDDAQAEETENRSTTDGSQSGLC